MRGGNLSSIIIGSLAALGGLSYMAAGGTVATIDGGGGIGAVTGFFEGER